MLKITKINFYGWAYSSFFQFYQWRREDRGTYFPLRLFSCKVSKYADVIFNYRLSFGLVTALYGFEKEIITVEMFNTILLCILFSSLIAAYFEKR